MSISGIQGHILEVTVVGCLKLKDTEWISRQDPYVCLEYANTKFRTRTCTDGGKNPVFQEKFVFTLIEGLREINILVWNSNTLSFDDFIGGGKAQIQDVLLRGYDDRPWPLQTKTGRLLVGLVVSMAFENENDLRYAGEVKLIMHYANAQRPDHTSYASAPPFPTPHQPQAPMYSSPYPSAPSAYQPPPTCHHHPPPSSYSGNSPYSSYPPDPTPPYSPYPYPPPNNQSVYPPAPYPPPPSSYPPTPYPPPSAYPPMPYPPPSYASPYPPSGHYPGQYPPY